MKFAAVQVLAFVIAVAIALPAREKPKVKNYDEKHYIWNGVLPDILRTRPTLANGHLGTTVHGQELFANGIFNGPDVQTHRAIVPSPAGFNVTGTQSGEEITRTYTVNAREGTYIEVLNGESFTLTHRIYAHRTRSRLLVVDLSLSRSNSEGELVFNVDRNERTETPDVNFVIENVENGRRYRGGSIFVAEQPNQEITGVHLYHDLVPETLTSGDGETSARWVFITSLSAFDDDSRNAFEAGKALSPDDLYAEHAAGWEDLWSRGAIDIEGDDKLAKSIVGSLFYILASCPLEFDELIPYVGLSPSGLPYGQNFSDYYGHIFWDQETWMYPPVLSLHSDIANILTEGRARVLPAARANALIWGNSGAQYPWEGGQTGAEVCPVEENSEKELHISGDISHAVKLYLDTTGDSSGRYNDILKGIAEFWISRMTFNETMQKYTILDVIPPDEYARGVNNSAFTNAIARLSIENAMEFLEEPFPVEDIYVPFDEELQYHPEYDGYTPDILIKQGDVILMGYPMEIDMPANVRLNDLNIYERVTDLDGPAMSWSMFSIGFLEMGEPERAAQNIEKNYAHIMNEFEVWNEITWGGGVIGAANFITGCGGFLQMMTAGYGGIRVKSDRMLIDPQFPPGVTRLRYTGLDYQGSEIDIDFNGVSISLTVTSQNEGSPAPQLVGRDGSLVLDLVVGVTYGLPANEEGKVQGYLRRAQ